MAKAKLAKLKKTGDVVLKPDDERGEHGPRIFTVKCVLGWREYTERFKSGENARSFVGAVLGLDKPRWKSPTLIVAKEANTLQIGSERLEEIMLKSEGEIDERTQEKVKEFLGGVWKNSDEKVTPDAKPVEKNVVTRNQGDTISLDDICQRNGWDSRKVRKALRDSGEKKEGRWQWATSEIESVETKIRRLLK